MTEVAAQPASAEPRTSSARRVLRVLAAIADAEEPVSVRDLARKLELSPSTTHRLLGTLRGEGFSTFDERQRTYGVGPQLYRVAARVTGRVNPVSFAASVAQEAAADFDETILFGLYLPDAGAMSFEARADGQQSLTYQVAMHTPVSLLWGASGQAILAYLPSTVRAAVLRKECPSPASAAPLPSRREIDRTLEAVLQRGFAVTHGEKLPGACGIAAAVHGSQGVMGSLCLTMPEHRMPTDNIQELGARVTRYAHRISQQLGGAA
ncbi:MAG: IclR family transcriptional regulator [Planctomycetota bacterium]